MVPKAAHGRRRKTYAAVVGEGAAKVLKVRASHEEVLVCFKDRGFVFANYQGDDGTLQVVDKRLALFLHWICLCVNVLRCGHLRWWSVLGALVRICRLYDLDGIVGFFHLDVALRAGNILVGLFDLFGWHIGGSRGGATVRTEAQEVGSSFNNAGSSYSKCQKFV